jgi:hypothetical protein
LPHPRKPPLGALSAVRAARPGAAACFSVEAQLHLIDSIYVHADQFTEGTWTNTVQPKKK